VRELSDKTLPRLRRAMWIELIALALFVIGFVPVGPRWDDWRDWQFFWLTTAGGVALIGSLAALLWSLPNPYAVIALRARLLFCFYAFVFIGMGTLVIVAVAIMAMGRASLGLVAAPLVLGAELQVVLAALKPYRRS
jgi:hypothetical protein